MAVSIGPDKLMKALDLILSHYANNQQPPQTKLEARPSLNPRRKDVNLSKKERITLLNGATDMLCNQLTRTHPDFVKSLNNAVATLLLSCNDDDSDVRLVAGENLNRIIKVFQDTHMNQILIEFYREMKKNGSSRSLRAALLRFGETCHLVRPNKRKIYMNNICPHIAHICARTDDEGLQETLSVFLVRISTILGPYASDKELRQLVVTILKNISFNSAAIRRHTATSVTSLVQRSKNPLSNSLWLIGVLLAKLNPTSGCSNALVLLGVLQVFQIMVPALHEDELKLGVSWSLGSGDAARDVREEAQKASLYYHRIYEVAMYSIRHSDHNIVNSALETLVQLLRCPLASLMDTLISSRGFSSVSMETLLQKTGADVESCEDTLPIEENHDDDTPDNSISSSMLSSKMTGSTVSLYEKNMSDTCSINYQPSIPDETDTDTDEGLQLPRSYLHGSDAAKPESFGDPEGKYMDGMLISDLPEYESEAYQPPGEAAVEIDIGTSSASASDQTLEFDVATCTGSPLAHFVRVVCKLLLGPDKGKLLSDKTSRVSVKSLALTCIAHAISVVPELLLLSVDPDSEDIRVSPQVADVLLYKQHDDVRVRGTVCSIITSFLHAAMKSSRGRFDQWLDEKSHIHRSDLVTMSSLLNVLGDIMLDESQMASKMVCAQLKGCCSTLLSSLYCLDVYCLVYKVLCLKGTTFWPLKVEVLGLLPCINLWLIKEIESRCQPQILQRLGLTANQSLNFGRDLLENMVLNWLGDDDPRVRTAAVETLAKIVPFYFEEGHKMSQVYLLLARLGHRFVEILESDAVSLINIFCMERVDLGLVQTNLACILSILNHRFNLSPSKYFQAGYFEAMLVLSTKYPPVVYQSAWGLYQITIPRVPGDSDIVGFPGNRSSSLGPLPMLVSMLTSSVVMFDLVCHQNILMACMNIISGAMVRLWTGSNTNAQSGSQNSTDGLDDTHWSASPDSTLSAYIQRVYKHIVRLLNIFGHVIDRTPVVGQPKQPTPPVVASKLTAIPGGAAPASSVKTGALAAFTSPKKFFMKRSTAISQGTLEDAKLPKSEPPMPSPSSTQATAESEKTTESSSKEKLGSFSSLPHYVKLYEFVQSCFSNCLMTSLTRKEDRFSCFLHSVLCSFGQLLEMSTLNDVGKHCGELLGYLSSCAKVDSDSCFLCVKLLLRAVFGCNAAYSRQPHRVPLSCLQHGVMLQEVVQDVTANLLCSEKCPNSFEGYVLLPSQSLDATYTACTTFWRANLRDFSLKATLLWQNQDPRCDEAKYSSYQMFIKAFEPVVVQALKLYISSGSVDVQGRVLDLLVQLIKLHVNYSLLDSDQNFKEFVVKQFDQFDSGIAPQTPDLISCIVRFLVQLTYDIYLPKLDQAKAIMSLAQVLQLCDRVTAGLTTSSPHMMAALQPIVEDLFIHRPSNRVCTMKDIESQEVVISKLLRITTLSRAFDMISIVLSSYKERDEESWRRFSRQIVDVIIPCLVNFTVVVEFFENFESFLNLLPLVSSQAFRPANIVLEIIFSDAQLTCQRARVQSSLVTVELVHWMFLHNIEESVLTTLALWKKEIGHLWTKFGFGEPHLMEIGTVPQAAEVLMLILLNCLLLGVRQLAECSSSIHENSFLVKVALSTCQKVLSILEAMLSSASCPKMKLLIVNVFQSLTTTGQSSPEPRKMAANLFGSCFSYAVSLLESYPILTLTFIKLSRLANVCLWKKLIHLYRQQFNDSTVELPYSSNFFTVICGFHITTADYITNCIHSTSNLEASRVSLLTHSPAFSRCISMFPRVLFTMIKTLSASEETSGYFIDLVSSLFGSSSWSTLSLTYQSKLVEVAFQSKWPMTLNCLENVLRAVLVPSNTALLICLDPIVETKLKVTLANSDEDSKCAIAQVLSSHLARVALPRSTSALLTTHGRHRNGSTSREEGTTFEPCLTLTSSDDVLHLVVGVIASSIPQATHSVLPVYEQLSEDQLARLLNNADFKADKLLVFLQHCLSYHKKCTQNDHVNNSCEPHDATLRLMLKAGLSKLRFVVLASLSKLGINAVESDIDKDLAQQLRGVANSELCPSAVVELTYMLRCLSAVTYPTVMHRRSIPLEDDLPFLLGVASVAGITAMCQAFVRKQAGWQSLVIAFNLFSQCLNLRATSPSCCSALDLYYPEVVQQVHYFVSAVFFSPADVLLKAKKGGIHSLLFASEPEMPASSKVCCRLMTDLFTWLRSISPINISHPTAPLDVLLSLRLLIIQMARHPWVNGVLRVPFPVWSMSWYPKFEGPYHTDASPLPMEILKERDTIIDFVRRVNLIGWTTKQQFEETWAALLGLLSLPSSVENISLEEELENTESCCLALRCITSLLLDTVLTPNPGNATISQYSMICPNTDLTFLNTYTGRRYLSLRKAIEAEIRLNESSGLSLCSSLVPENLFRAGLSSSLLPEHSRHMLNHITDRPLFPQCVHYPPESSSYYNLRQLPTASIRSRLSSSDVSVEQYRDYQDALLIQVKETRSTTEQLDIHSCLQFILDFFEQILPPSSVLKTALMLKFDIVKSLSVLSDLLPEMQHYEWILVMLLDFHQNHPLEDDMVALYLYPVLCKCTAVLRLDNSVVERVVKVVKAGLKSPHVPLQIACVSGFESILEGRLPFVTSLILPVLMEFLSQKIIIISEASSHLSRQLLHTVWSSSFHLVANFGSELPDLFFAKAVVQACLHQLNNHCQNPHWLDNLLRWGLELMILSRKLMPQEMETITKSSLALLASTPDSLVLSNTALLVTCIYGGPDGEFIESKSSEAALSSMEKIAALTSRLRQCSTSEGIFLTRVLPPLLTDLFPDQDVMNKVIGELLSSNTSYAKLAARVLCQVFRHYITQGKHELVRTWVLLSLDNFIQRTPLHAAVWRLSCLWISCSFNPCTRSLFDYLVSRFGRLERTDHLLFCHVGLDFFLHQELTEDQKVTFIRTFDNCGFSSAAYRELVIQCRSNQSCG